MSLFEFIKGLFDASQETRSGQSVGAARAAELASTSEASTRSQKPADAGSTCPYCAHTLAQRPLRKKKCPSCGNYIYVRSTPAGEKKILVTEREAAKIDDQWQHHHHMNLLDSDPDYRREYEQIKAQLMVERGKEPSVGEIRWVLAGKHLVQCIRDGDWGIYRDTKVEMAQQLEEEQKLKQALGTYLEVCYLDANGPCNRGAKPFDPSQAVAAPGIARKVRELSRSLGLQPDEVKRLFTEAAEIYHNGLPVDSAEAWGKVHLDLAVASADNPIPGSSSDCPPPGS